MTKPRTTFVQGLSSPASFAKRVLILAAIVALGIIAWALSHVFILLFGGIVVAMALRALAEPLAERTGLPQRWSLTLVVAAVLALVGLGGWLFGARVSQQFDQILARLPEAWAAMRGWLEQSQIGRYVLDSLTASLVGADKAPGALAKLATGTFGAIADIAIILVVGLYLAAEPAVYRQGAIKLVPPAARERVGAAFDAIRVAMKRWMLGQGMAMLAVGAATGLGLWALGIPMALGLAILAGLLEFVPYLGPFLAAVPALLIAFAKSPADALWVLLLYVAIQEIENWALIPLIEKWAVKLPPVLALLSLVVFGVLFGIPGIVFAAPLMIVVMILVQKLYLEGILGEKA